MFNINELKIMEEEREKRRRALKNRYCVVKGCKGRDSDEISLFRVPPYDKEAWCMNLQLNPLELKSSTRVCSRHFEEKWLGNSKLKAGARPTLHLGEHKIKAFSIDHTKQRFSYRECCIVGCKTTSPPDTLHHFPTDPKRYRKWISICSIKTTILNRKHKFICVNHFKPKDVKESRVRKNAKPLASLSFSMQDDDAPIIKANNLASPQSANSSFHSHSSSDDCDTDNSSTSDGLECGSCDTCFIDYLSKYKAVLRQREEAEARHLIETFALQNQIEELTTELKKLKNV